MNILDVIQVYINIIINMQIDYMKQKIIKFRSKYKFSVLLEKHLFLESNYFKTFFHTENNLDIKIFCRISKYILYKFEILLLTFVLIFPPMDTIMQYCTSIDL